MNEVNREGDSYIVDKNEIEKIILYMIGKYRPNNTISVYDKLIGKESCLNMTSLEIISLIVDIELEFGIIIKKDRELMTVEDIIGEVYNQTKMIVEIL